MNGKVLLDTNIVIAFFANENIVVQNLKLTEKFFIPAIVLGELYFGAGKSKRRMQNIERIDELVATTTILGTDTDTARYYGQMKTKLRQKGKPIPENDIWIAALALQHDLMLITRDAHFEHVEDLRVMAWE